MLSSYLILLREVLEVALVVGIVLSFLARIEQKSVNRFVWLAVASGVALSLLTAWLFTWLVGEFEGPAEQIFEGTAMLVGALLLFPMISWFSHQQQTSQDLTKRMTGVALPLLQGEVFLVVLVSVLRDGVETVLFLGASSFNSPQNNLLGGLLGLATAVALGWLLFRGSRKIKLGPFFMATNLLLILFGAGLLARSLGEFTEAGLLPPLVSALWNLNPAANADGSLSLWHEDGAIGGLFKSLFGYVGAPSLLQLLGYGVYLLTAVSLLVRKQKPKTS